MKLSERETVLCWATGVLMLCGVTLLLGQPKVREWRAVREARGDAIRKIDMAERMVTQGPQWNVKLAGLRKSLPQYPPDKDVTADLLGRIEQIAQKSGLTLTSRDAEQETQHGDLYELAVNCKWEGKLDAVVQFLFDLQAQDVMLDASQLTIAPNERKVPRGSFTIDCSYARTGVVPAPAGASGPARKN